MEEDRPDDTNTTADMPAAKTRDTSVSKAKSESPRQQAETSITAAVQHWQNRLLPWMIRMVVGLTAFFFIASLVQLFYLHWEISKAPILDPKSHAAMLDGLRQSIEKTSAASSPLASTAQQLTTSVFAILSSLENNSIARRYHQANVSLMSRVWTRYLGFVTGMVLAMVGAIFILGKLQIPESQAAFQTETLSMQLRTTSPGIILAALGTALMVITIVTHHEINVQDRPLYLQGWQMTTGSTDDAAWPGEADKINEHAPPLRARETESQKNGEGIKEGVVAPSFLEKLQESMNQPKTNDPAAGITR